MRKFGLVALLVGGLFLFTGIAEAVLIDNLLDSSDPRYFSVDIGTAGSSSYMYYNGMDQVFNYGAYLDINGSVFSLSSFSLINQSTGFTSDSQYLTQSYSNGVIHVTVDSQIGLGSQRLQTNYSIMPTIALTDVNFYQYLDPDLNGTVSNDYAYVHTGPRLMVYDLVPVSTFISLMDGGMSEAMLVGWEIDEWPDLRNNITTGGYDLTNAILSGQPDDQTMALQWYLGDISGGSVKLVEAEVLTTPVPEPATMILLGSGLLGLAAFRRKRS